MRRAVAILTVTTVVSMTAPAVAQTTGIPATIAWVENNNTLYVGSGELDDWELIDSGRFIENVVFVNDGLDVVYNFLEDPDYEIRVASAAGDSRPRVLANNGGFFDIDPSDRGSDQVVYSSINGFESTSQDRLFSVAVDGSNPSTAIGPEPDEGYGFGLVGVSAEFGAVFVKIPVFDLIEPSGTFFVSLLSKQDGFVRDLAENNSAGLVSPDGQTVVLSDFRTEQRRVGLLSLVDNTRVELDTTFPQFPIVAMSPDGSTIIAIVGGDIGSPPEQSTAMLFDAGGNTLGDLQLPQGEVSAASFSPDGRLFTVGGSSFSFGGFIASYPVDYSTGYAVMGEPTVIETLGSVSDIAHSPRSLPELPVRPVQPGMVNPTNGEWHLSDSTGEPFSFFFGVPGDYPVVGDWDCDGIDTPGLYRQSDGFAYLRNSSNTGTADVEFVLGIPGDLPLAGDFNGDGCDTVSVYRPSESRVFISNRLGADGGAFVADYDYFFGNAGDKPFVGDFDGDGIDTIGLHRESNGLVYFTNFRGPNGPVAPTSDEFFYGIADDRMFSGDWNEDGTDSVAVFRPTEAMVYINYRNTQAPADETQPLGFPSYTPVAGRFIPIVGPSVVERLPRFDASLIPPGELAELENVSVAVLLPVPPEPFEAGAVAGSDWYAVGLAMDGADVLVNGQASDLKPGQIPWEPEFFDVHGIKEVHFLTNEAAYDINVECAAIEADPRCADFSYVQALFESISLLER